MEQVPYAAPARKIFTAMINSAIRSRLTWRQAIIADIEADGAALVVFTGERRTVNARY